VRQGQIIKEVVAALVRALHPRQQDKGRPQLNCPTSCWTISVSGQASAKARMYMRFAREKPRISGKAIRELSPGCKSGYSGSPSAGRSRTGARTFFP
jgi:hypothetical protein